MRTFRKNILVAFISLISLTIMFFALFFFNKDFQELIFSLMVQEETVYAKGYSLKSWKEVRINDTVEKVIKLLGEPIEKDKVRDNYIVFYYSKQGPKNTNYRERTIVFNGEGKVKEIVREFYLD